VIRMEFDHDFFPNKGVLNGSGTDKNISAAVHAAPSTPGSGNYFDTTVADSITTGVRGTSPMPP